MELRAFNSMPKPARGIDIYLLGFEQGFWQGFDHKNIPVVLGIYPGFAKKKSISPLFSGIYPRSAGHIPGLHKKKVNIPAIFRPHRGQIIRIFNGCEVWIEYSITRVTVISSDGIFNLHQTTIIDSFSCILFF